MTENHAHKILYVYAHFECEPGAILNANHFLGVGKFKHWLASDLDDGIQLARRSGWVEEADRGWRLTTAGFAEAGKNGLAPAAS